MKKADASRTKRKAAPSGGALRGRAPQTLAGISTQAVLKATGKDWSQWIAALDRAGAKGKEHPAIAEMLAARFGVRPWWSQMITVGYEHARKGRVKHQKADGYSVSASRTLAAPVSVAFLAFFDPATRRRWLPDDLHIRRSTRDKSLRITWSPERRPTNLDVNLYAKGERRCAVQIQHDKLPSAAAATREKRAWAARLDRLRSLAEAD